MQATAQITAQPRRENKISIWLDKILSQPYLYALFTLIALKPRALCDMDELMASILHLTAFPLFRTATYVIFTLVLACYALRWALRDICRVNKTLCSILGMFLFLAGITFVFDGASGYHIDWHAGFALMMMIDMGLQREKKSLLRGMTGALEFWVYLNVVSFAIFPRSLTLDGSAPGWMLGNRAFYYRILFPALAFALLRYQACGRQYALRTALMALLALITIAHQGGGTALVGIALWMGLMLWCNRRALPRYVTPFVFTLLAAAVFAGIQYFDLQNLFASLITGVLHKNTTLSGRTVIWDRTMTVVFNNPITGVGYLPVAYMHELLGGASYSHTHNQLLELLLHGGMVAVALYLAAVYFASAEAVKYRRSRQTKLIALLLCAFSLMGVAEIFHNDPIYYALFVLLSRADCLSQEDKMLPRISVIKRIRRDLKKKKA